MLLGVASPKRAVERSSPSSSSPSGTSTPAIEQTVGSQSTPATTASSTRPAGTLPGHRTIPGTRMPPSYRLRFRPRNGPAEPIPLCPALRTWMSSGPLSLEKKTIVSSARPIRSIPSSSRPIWASRSVTEP